MIHVSFFRNRVVSIFHNGGQVTGADPKISDRESGSQILESGGGGGGGGIRLFSAAFSHFLINLLQIFHQKGVGGGGGLRHVRPLP